jgi:hypothetical protein
MTEQPPTPEQWAEAQAEALEDCLYRQWLILALVQASQPESAQ